MDNQVKDSFVNIRITEELKAKLVKEASLKKLTVSKFANRLFERYFESKEIKITPVPTTTFIDEKPKDLAHIIIVGSMISLVAIIWIFVTNRPQKNEFKYMNHEK